jgi:hypothetical protein
MAKHIFDFAEFQKEYIKIGNLFSDKNMQQYVCIF